MIPRACVAFDHGAASEALTDIRLRSGAGAHPPGDEPALALSRLNSACIVQSERRCRVSPQCGKCVLHVLSRVVGEGSAPYCRTPGIHSDPQLEV
jgi:hypothetical protein